MTSLPATPPAAPAPKLSPSLALTLADEVATQRLGAILARLARAGDVLCLSGDLGAGKSALARALIRALAGPGAAELEVPSPTFTLVQLYDQLSPPVRHFDLYRLHSADEVIELAWEDELEGTLSLVEWPDRLGELTPPDRLEIAIRNGQNTSVRCVDLTFFGAFAARWNDYNDSCRGIADNAI